MLLWKPSCKIADVAADVAGSVSVIIGDTESTPMDLQEAAGELDVPHASDSPRLYTVRNL